LIKILNRNLKNKKYIFVYDLNTTQQTMTVKNTLFILLSIILIYGCKGKSTQDSTHTETSSIPYGEYNKIDTTGYFMYHSDDFPDNLNIIRKDDKAGVIDAENNLIIPCIYESIEGMYRNHELLGVRRTEDRRCGMINFKTGRLVIPYDYHSFDRVSHTDRYIKAYTDGQKYCIIDLKTEDVIIPPRYWTIWAHGGYFFCNEGDNRFKLIDSTNTVVSSHIYNGVRGWSDKNGSLGFIVKRNGQFGVMMNKGNGFSEVIPCEYDDISDFYSGMFIPTDPIQVLQKDGKYGILSTTGKILIPCEYDEFSDEFIDGLISTSRNNKWGLVDVDKDILTEVAPCIYDTLKWYFPEDNGTSKIKAIGIILNERTDTIDYEKHIR